MNINRYRYQDDLGIVFALSDEEIKSSVDRAKQTWSHFESSLGEKDISLLESMLARREFGEIIKSPELFWLAFCKALSQIKNSSRKHFAVSVKENTLIITGEEEVIVKIKDSVEEIRKIFSDGYLKEKGFLIVFIEHICCCYIREKQDIIDLTCWFEEQGGNLMYSRFQYFIRPTMKHLCESLRVTCSEEDISQSIIMRNNDGVYQTEAVQYKIECLSTEHLVYPIDPKKIPPRDDLQTSMYALYEKQIVCDLTIVAKDGMLVVHSLPLFLNGGIMIQNMLKSPMKESVEKKVHFEKFSLQTVKAFMDFIYLGEAGLDYQLLLKKGVDLVELFEMAHMYQVSSLIDCCTNLLSLSAQAENLDQIKFLADTYDNEHLKKLYEHLFAKTNSDTPSISYLKV